MVKVICKHSGIEFEARTKRTTQHPQVAAIKQQATRYNVHDKAMEAIDEASTMEWSNINDFVNFVNGLVKSAESKRLFMDA